MAKEKTKIKKVEQPLKIKGTLDDVLKAAMKGKPQDKPKK
jgi:hypothetical protein